MAVTRCRSNALALSWWLLASGVAAFTFTPPHQGHINRDGVQVSEFQLGHCFHSTSSTRLPQSIRGFGGGARPGSVKMRASKRHDYYKELGISRNADGEFASPQRSSMKFEKKPQLDNLSCHAALPMFASRVAFA